MLLESNDLSASLLLNIPIGRRESVDQPIASIHLTTGINSCLFIRTVGAGRRIIADHPYGLIKA